MYRTLFMLCLTFLAVQACHKKRRRREVNALNDFFDTCMAANSLNDYTWESVVDFVINLGSWFDDNQYECNVASFGGSFTNEAGCWLSALEKLIMEPDLSVAQQCVCDYLYDTHAASCPVASRRKRQAYDVDFDVVIDDEDCPYVDPEEYANRLRQKIQQGNLGLENDRTSLDLVSVVDFVRSEGLCVGDCVCDRNYTSAADHLGETKQLSCQSCWPTRLSSMVKESSSLRPLALQVTNEVEVLGAVRPTGIECRRGVVLIHVGKSKRNNMNFNVGDQLVMSRSAVSDVSTVTPRCIANLRNNYRLRVIDCGIELKKNATHVELKSTVWKVSDPPSAVPRKAVIVETFVKRQAVKHCDVVLSQVMEIIQ